MDMEEEILAFGETEVWVECDQCGRAFGGPDVNKSVVAVRHAIGHTNVCVDCLQRTRGKSGTSAEGMEPSRPVSVQTKPLPLGE